MQFELRRARQAEIEDLGIARLGDEDVGRLQIAMDDAAVMRVLHGIGNLGDERQPLPQIELLQARIFIEPASAHELHREVRLRTEPGVGDASLVDLRYAVVLQTSEELVLVLETPQHRGRGDAGPDDLEGDTPSRPLLFSLVDDAHRAFSDERDDAEGSDAGGVRRSRARRMLRRAVGVDRRCRRSSRASLSMKPPEGAERGRRPARHG